MDEIEGRILSGFPAQALRLTLTRSTIKMQHSASWSVDKVNKVEDLIICLEGEAAYVIEGETLRVQPGDALLIPRHRHFVGWNPTDDLYTGIAQHFTLDIFGRHDLIHQMHLRRVVRLSKWPVLRPLVEHYRHLAPASSTTLTQHHLFMFFLICFIDDAFLSWRETDESLLGSSDALALSVMLAANRIAADPLGKGLADLVVENARYNPDYFMREFRKRIGSTPKKYQEFKRMERAMYFLEAGRSISETAAEIGYTDVYYFSRMFKRHIGISPRGFVKSVRLSRDGAFPRGDEDGQLLFPAR